MKKFNKVAIIGTGFLGRTLADKTRPFCKELLLTHNQNQYFKESIHFDFFTDDPKIILADRDIEAVMIPAKLEFEEDSGRLKKAMAKFLEACQGKRVVYVSSDGIFDGQKGMYTEEGTPMPVTLYGRNLKICEDLVKNSCDKYLIVRPSYIYGYSLGRLDSRLWKAKEILMKGEQLERFVDMFKSPMDVNQTAEAIVKLVLSDYKGIVHVAGSRMSVYNFTKEGMEALKIPTKNLIGARMPEESLSDFLADTSLNNSLIQKLTGTQPMSIKKSLEKFEY